MKRINKKSINYGAKALTFLAFVLIFTPINKVSAFDCFHPDGNYYNDSGYYNTYQNTYYQPAVYTPPPTPIVTPTVYSNNTTYAAGYTPAAPVKKVAKVTTVKKVAAAPKPQTTLALCTIPTTLDGSGNTDNNSSLAANILYGSNSFLPSGLIQWILFAIFILILIILTRRIFGGREAYQATPLKHD